jgi:hypothetical protein
MLMSIISIWQTGGRRPPFQQLIMRSLTMPKQGSFAKMRDRLKGRGNRTKGRLDKSGSRARATAHVFLLLALFLSGSKIFAQQSGLGVGIMLGDPTGLSGKLWIGDTAIDAGAAWSFSTTGGQNAVHLHVDYLFHSFGVFGVNRGKLPIYFGVGGRARLETDPRIGVRIPFGLAYLFENAPVDIFFEIAPLLDLVPATAFGVNAALGFRFFFQGSGLREE